MAIRLRDVAETAGVSMTTASIVLRRQPGARVSPATRQRVHQAAEQLGYRPRERHPARRLMGLVGLGEVDIAAYEFVRALVDAAGGSDCLVVLLPRHDVASAVSSVLGPNELQIEGLIVVAAQAPGRAVPEVPERLVGSTVVVDWAHRVPEEDEAGSVIVRPDDAEAARVLGTSLMRHGHRRVAVVAHEGEAGVAARWIAGLRDVFGGALDVLAVDSVEGSGDAIQSAGTDLPSALVCMGEGSTRAAVALGSARRPDVAGGPLILSRCRYQSEDPAGSPVHWIRPPAERLAEAALEVLASPGRAGESGTRRAVEVPFTLDSESLSAFGLGWGLQDGASAGSADQLTLP